MVELLHDKIEASKQRKGENTFMKQSELIGHKLKQHRIGLGWTQEYMADKLHVRQNTVSVYEKSGIHDIDVIMDINHMLGINLLSDTEEDQLFNQTILKKIYNHYSNAPTRARPSEIILNKDILQNKLLYGYGGETESLERNLRTMECNGLIRLCRNELIENDDSVYILMTAKGVLSFDVDDDFPSKWVYEHLPNSKLQKIVNPKLEEVNAGLDRKQRKLIEEEKQESLRLEKLKIEYKEKISLVDETLKQENVSMLTEPELVMRIKRVIKRKRFETLNKYFSFIRNELPDKNSIMDLVENVFDQLKNLPEEFDGNPKIINSTYCNWINVFYNLLFESYQKAYCGEGHYEPIFCITGNETWYPFEGSLLGYNENEIKHLIESILPEEMDYQSYFAASTLLKALIMYLLENKNIPNEDKNFTNIKKLIFAAEVSENDPNTKSPLDKLFAKVESLNPEYLCVDAYKQFKFLDNKERKFAFAICLEACSKYLNRPISAKNKNLKKIQSNMEQLNIMLCNEMDKRSTLQAIQLQNRGYLYCYIFSQTLAEACKNIHNYKDVLVYGNLGPKKTLSDLFKENAIHSVKDAVSRIVLKKDEVMANNQFVYDTEDCGVGFNYTID